MPNFHGGLTFTWQSALGFSSTATIGWNNQVIMVPLATNALPVSATAIGSNSSKWYAFNSNSGVQANSGTMAALTKSILEAHFTNPLAGLCYVIAVDKAAATPDTCAGILQRFIETVTGSFFIVNVATRVAADIVACANYLSGIDPKRIVWTLDDDSTLKGDSTTFNGGTYGSSFTNKGYCALMYDSSASSFNEARQISKFLSFDPMIYPAGASFTLTGNVTTPNVTQSEFNNVVANNVMIPGVFGPSSTFVKPGKLLDGVEIRHALTRFLVHTQTDRLVKTLIVNRADFGDPLNASDDDQKLIASKIESNLLDHLRIKRIRAYTKELIPLDPTNSPGVMNIAFSIDYFDGLDTLNITFKEE